MNALIAATSIAIFVAQAPAYEYRPLKSYPTLTECIIDALMLQASLLHAYCDDKPSDFVDGSVRPQARPTTGN